MMTTLSEKTPLPTLQMFRAGIALLGTLLVFFFAIELIGASFSHLNSDLLRQLILATYNPFIGLFIGLLSTAILQSSSTITAMLVAVVASGNLELAQAVPIVMGANIGTTVTSTIVAMGHINDRSEFRRAIVAATMHDLFNIIVTCILFPIEYFTGFLTNLSQSVADGIGNYWGPIHQMLLFIQVPMRTITDWLIGLAQNWVWVILTGALALLFVAIRLFGLSVNQLLIGHTKERMTAYFFEKPLKSLLWGTFFTGIVQSSSVTTSLIVPMVAKGKLEPKQAFSFLMGANLGTTVTALLAGLAVSSSAMGVAVAHILFNLIGILIIFPIPAVRNIPVRLARLLGIAAVRNRLVGFLYLVVTFFLLPFLLIYFTK